MQDDHARIVRRHRKRTDDGKGLRRYIAGKRFRLTAGVDGREADERFQRIEALWRDNENFCRKEKRSTDWTETALWAAEFLRRGALRVPLPPIDDILDSYGHLDWPDELSRLLGRYIEDGLPQPKTADDLSWDGAKVVHEIVSGNFPSVNWLGPTCHAVEIIASHERAARGNIERYSRLTEQTPPDPSTPLVSGTLHEALRAYEDDRRKDFTRPDGSFDNSGHHMLGIIRAVRERSTDLPLAQLDFARCQNLLAYWRDRPEHSKTRQPLSKKTCQNHFGEVKRFFNWLHLSGLFGWRKPLDYDSLNIRVRSISSDRPSLGEIGVETFSLDELTLLYRHVLPFERLLLVWCLNCAHGAAEFGRVEWGDLFLRQEHPWRKHGLKLETSEEDGWVGFIRPKSGVLGWWWLWPETLRLIEWWKAEWTRNLHREPTSEDRVLLTKVGTPLYRDESRNAQTGFGNAWIRLLDRIQEAEGKEAIRRLPFGTLRNQLPDRLGGGQAEAVEAVEASVALCHGIPHGEDKLLYKHYSNKPWAGLFLAQRDYRDYLKPMFEAVPDVLAVYDPVADRIARLWLEGVRDLPTLADRIEVSEMTVRRRLHNLGSMQWH